MSESRGFVRTQNAWRNRAFPVLATHLACGEVLEYQAAEESRVWAEHLAQCDAPEPSKPGGLAKRAQKTSRQRSTQRAIEPRA